jgi:predicted RNA-binding protein with PUA-like domain
MNYWLVKSEPAEFGIDHLAQQKFEPWTGVRNYQARNYMRDTMKVGDIALFYHSNITPPGIVGLAKVVSKPYPDPTQFDEKSEYFDPKSSPENPRWQLINLAFEEKFDRLIPLDKLRTNPALEGLLVIKRGMRLSVQPVKEEHFQAIVAMQ